MASLPNDIILDLLCHLSVKDLLRFRCISKSFCSSIDDRDFMKLHLSHSLKTNTNRSIVFRCITRKSLFSVDLDSLKTVQKLSNPLDQGEYTEILGSCNGLVALFNAGGEISLWNPSTRKSQLLRADEKEFPPWHLCSHIVYGLGYDTISDDYKLVRIIQFKSFGSEVKIYSLRTNSWRRIQDFPLYLKYRRTSGVFASNALHWLVCKNIVSDTQHLIAALDLETEEYRIIELPDSLSKGIGLKLKAMGGCLYLSAHYSGEAQAVDIWMMKEYGVKESWTKFISLKRSETIPDFVFGYPLAFSKNGERLLLHLDASRFGWYDMRSKIIDTLNIQGSTPSSFGEETLVESLIPLNDNGAMINKKKHCGGTKNKTS